MKRSLLATLGVSAWLLLGCSGKQYFEAPKSYDAPAVATTTYQSTIVDLSRDGATLRDGRYIGKQGVSRQHLGEGYRYLSENSAYLLAGNDAGILKIIDKSLGESVRSVALHTPIVSATIHKNTIAYILNNNAFGLYHIKSNKKIMENRAKRTFAINTRAASPMFIDNLVAIPTLDGKLIVLDSHNTDNAKVIYLSSEKVFNNVVHLSRMRNRLIAATAKKVITLGGAEQKEYSANISEVTVAGGFVYLFTIEGEVIKLDRELRELKSKRFKYAHFSAATAFDGKIYALDQTGQLIVLSDDLTTHKVYDLGTISSPVLMVSKHLYKDGKVINLASLGL